MSRSGKLRILVVFGTRPEAIKLAPIIQQMRRHSGEFDVRVCNTGQHREMFRDTLDLFGVSADMNLQLMRENQPLAELHGRAVRSLAKLMENLNPDWVLVQGDTTSAMAAAFAAYYQGISVAHVEAGLRTGDIRQPFPEEANRKTISLLAERHFAATAQAKENLLREGVPEEKILITGNPVVDAVQEIAGLPGPPPGTDPLAGLPANKRLLTVTVHRRENLGRPLRDICRALVRLPREFPDVHLAFPVHSNPEVWRPVHRLLGGAPGISLLPPLNYRDFIRLLRRSYFILSDSGGIQEEAPSLGKPVLVLRNKTERPEALESGYARLIGTAQERVFREAARLLTDPLRYAAMTSAPNPYGDGHAAERICRALTVPKLEPEELSV